MNSLVIEMSTNSSTLNDCMPDISNLTEEERSSIISVFVKAKVGIARILFFLCLYFSFLGGIICTDVFH